MITTARTAAILAGMAALSACAQGPRVDIARSGMLPPAGASYAPLERGPTAAVDALSACLAGHGLAANGAPPTYLMLVTASDRPGTVGAASGDGNNKDRPWLPGAMPGRRPLRSLTLVLVRAATGEEVFRIVAGERYVAGKTRKPPVDLAAASCANLVPAG